MGEFGPKRRAQGQTYLLACSPQMCPETPLEAIEGKEPNT